MSEIQAVLFNKHMVTTKQAEKWLKDNKIKPMKRVHKTKNLLRYRIRLPSKYKRMRYKKINSFVSFIIGFK